MKKSCETELRYRAIFDQSPYGILLIDNRGKITEFNEMAHRELGYSREEFAKLHLSDIDAFQSPEEVKESIEEVLSKGSARFEVKHKTKSGDVRDVRVITRVLNLSGKRFFQTIWEDITERKRAEEALNRHREKLEDLVSERTTELSRVNEQLKRDIAERKRIEGRLRESEERFRRIFQDGPLGMMIADHDYNILRVNKAFCEMSGYTEQELAGHSVEDITHPEDRKKSEALSKRAFEGKTPFYHLEKRYIKKNGDVLWINLTATAIRDQKGQVLYAIGMIEDISERKSSELMRENLIFGLKDALAKIKTLKGLLPMCAWCKKIRDDQGYWKKVETYIREHSDASFTHGICPDCLKKESPEAYNKVFNHYAEEKNNLP